MGRELTSIRTAHAHKAAREQELERELARVEEEKRRCMQQEAVALRRAEDAERELDRSRHREQEMEKKLLFARDAETHLVSEIKELRADREQVRKAMEAEAAKKQSLAKARARRDKKGVGARLRTA